MCLAKSCRLHSITTKSISEYATYLFNSHLSMWFNTAYGLNNLYCIPCSHYRGFPTQIVYIYFFMYYKFNVLLLQSTILREILSILLAPQYFILFQLLQPNLFDVPATKTWLLLQQASMQPREFEILNTVNYVIYNKKTSKLNNRNRDSIATWQRLPAVAGTCNVIVLQIFQPFFFIVAKPIIFFKLLL